MTTNHHFTIGAVAPKGSVYDLPAASMIADEYGRAYRVTEGHTADPFDAGETRDLQIMDDQGPVTVLSIPGDELHAEQLDALPVGAYVVDNDGDLWRRVDLPTRHDSVHAVAFVLCTIYVYTDGVRGSTVPFPYRPTVARSARSLIANYGPVFGAHAEPGSIKAKGHVVPGMLDTVDGEYVSRFFAPNAPERPDTDDDDARPYADPPSVRLTVKFDDPGDPDTADNSLDLDDLYRAKPPTIVVDSDGDLWRRQVTGEGARVWVLVVEDGDPKRGDVMGSTSERLSRLFGPIAYAPADDVKAALSLIPREVVGVIGRAEPVPAPAPEPDTDTEYALDAAVEAALTRAGVALSDDGEHVVVTITRDRDGRVNLRTEVTETVGDDLA